MTTKTDNAEQKLSLGQKDFKRLSSFIYENFGINLGEHKRVMLESRLQKRLKKLEINSFSLYCDFLFSQEGLQNELLSMIDLVTTNKTDFFREPVKRDPVVILLAPHRRSEIFQLAIER